jgi:preprotein translocase SecE subunit
MAKEQEKTVGIKPKKRSLKKSETIREKAEKPKKSLKTRRLHKTRTAVGKPATKAKNFLKKEYHIPLPDNKVGKFLGKKGYIWPKFFRESYQELRQVQWPGRKETISLSLAVFMFAIFFSAIVAVVDLGLDKIFEQLIVK